MVGSFVVALVLFFFVVLPFSVAPHRFCNEANRNLTKYHYL